MFNYNPAESVKMPNFQEDFLRGQEFAAKKQEWEAQNALRSAMGQYGAAAAEGDQNALRELAKYDPKYALGMMDTRQGMDMRTRQDTRQAEAHSSGLQLDQARLDQIREQSRTAASEHSLKMDEATRARELEETNRVGSAMSMAWQKGPEEFARFMGSEQMKDAPPELRGLSYEDAPYGIAMLGGAAEGFKAPEVKPHNVPAGGTVIDANNPAAGAIFTAPQEAPQKGTGQKEEADLRGEYNKMSKDFYSVHDAYGRITATEGSTPQADMSLIFQFMKMLDPGSTVREGEYASAEQTRGLPDTVVALYNKALTGETLTDQQRQEFRAQAGNLYERAKTDNAANAERYRGLATEYGLNPDRVVMPYGAEFEAAPPSASPPPAGPEAAMPQSAIDAGIDPNLWQYLSPEDKALWN